MKPLLLLALAAILGMHFLHAQSLSPSVISSSGAFYQNGSAMLSSTIGEMTKVETYSSGGSILTQGFQQAFDFNVGIQHQSTANTFEIFPNPSTGSITVSMPGSGTDDVLVNVTDAIGKLVYSKEFKRNTFSNNIMLSLENLIDGMYVIEVKTKTEQHFRKINIIK